MDKVLEIFASMQGYAQVATVIVAAVLAGTILVTALVGITKIVCALFRTKRISATFMTIGLTIVACCGLIITGHPGCVAIMIVVIAIYITYTLGFFSRTEVSVKNGMSVPLE